MKRMNDAKGISTRKKRRIEASIWMELQAKEAARGD